MIQKDDLISRQAAIDAIRAEDDYTNTAIAIGLGRAMNVIEQLPSAEPEPKPVGCSGCRYERFGNRVCDVCSRFYVDRYEAERRSDGV